MPPKRRTKREMFRLALKTNYKRGYDLRVFLSGRRKSGLSASSRPIFAIERRAMVMK